MQFVVVPVQVAQAVSQKSHSLLLGFSMVISFGQSFKQELLYKNVPETQLSHTSISEHVIQGEIQLLHETGSIVASVYNPWGQVLTQVWVVLSATYKTL